MPQDSQFCPACGARVLPSGEQAGGLGNDGGAATVAAPRRRRPSVHIALVAVGAVIVLGGVLALSRHGRALEDKAQSNAAASRGDYTAAIAYLEAAQSAWPLNTQQPAIKRDRALLASNGYFLRGSRAFRSKQWATAVKDLQGVVQGNVHFTQAQAMLTTAQKRRTQLNAAVQFAADLSTFQSDVGTMWADYNTEINYLNGAWTTLSSNYSLSPNSASLTNAANFMPSMASAFSDVATAGTQVGQDVGSLTTDGLTSPSLQTGYTAMTAVVAAVQDDSTAIYDEFQEMRSYANGNGSYGDLIQISSYISQTNKDLTSITRNLSVEGSDMAEYLGVASSSVGPIQGYGGIYSHSQGAGATQATQSPSGIQSVQLPTVYKLPTGTTLQAVRPRPKMIDAGYVKFNGATLPVVAIKGSYGYAAPPLPTPAHPLAAYAYTIPASMANRLSVYYMAGIGAFLGPRGWVALSAMEGADGSSEIILAPSASSGPSKWLELDTSGACQGCAIDSIAQMVPSQRGWASGQGMGTGSLLFQPFDRSVHFVTLGSHTEAFAYSAPGNAPINGAVYYVVAGANTDSFYSDEFLALPQQEHSEATVILNFFLFMLGPAFVGA